MLVPGTLAGGIVGTWATSGVWSIGSVTSDVATHKDTWEEVANGLEESSALEDGEALRAVDAGLFGWNSLRLDWRCPVLCVTRAPGPQWSC